MAKQFGKAVRLLKKGRAPHPEQITGLLGVIRGGSKVVDVPGRNGFVYVRLRGRVSELIQAVNDAVSSVYDLPVIVERDRTNPNRYRVVSRDIGRYGDWGSQSPYLPAHGTMHSFNDDGSGGADIVWVYSRQVIPGLVAPSGSAGGMGVQIYPFIYYHNSKFYYSGNTGTASLTPYKPTGSSASVILVYVDMDSGNPYFLAGGFPAATVTGTAEFLTYLPVMPTGSFPLAGIRLVSGTNYIGWDNLYDLRMWGIVTHT